MAKLTHSIILALIATGFVTTVESLIDAIDAHKGQIPYMASISPRDDTPLCGAAIINNWYIITSAYMLSNSKPENFDVYLGAWKLNGIEDVKAEMAEIKIHPNYESRKKHHDVALVRMVKEIKFSEFIQPIGLPQADFPNVKGETLFVSGFGLDAVSFLSQIKRNYFMINFLLGSISHYGVNSSFRDLEILLSNIDYITRMR